MTGRRLRLALVSAPWVAVVLLAMPAAVAAPATAITLGTPFPVAFQNGGVSFANTSCTGPYGTHAPFFYNVTGNFRAGVSAPSQACSLVNVTATQSREQWVFAISLPPLAGNHSARADGLISFATADHFTSGGCPARNYVPVPGQFAQLGCADSTYRFLSVSWTFFDSSMPMGTGMAVGARGHFDESVTQGWANMTTCRTDASGTWGCVSAVGGSYKTTTMVAGAVISSPGFSWATENRSFSLWANDTTLISSHTYVLAMEVDLTATSEIDQQHLAHRWNAAAGAYIHMGRPGAFLHLGKVTIS